MKHFYLIEALGELAASILDSFSVSHKGLDAKIKGVVAEMTSEQLFQLSTAYPAAAIEQLLPMQTLAVACDAGSESDYETAIEMTHNTWCDSTTVLVLKSGARAVIFESSLETHTTYLEPDFDHLEETGKVVYLNHASEHGAHREFCVSGYFLVPDTRAALSEEEEGVSPPSAWRVCNNKTYQAAKEWAQASTPMPEVTVHYELVPVSVSKALAKEYAEALSARNKALIENMCAAALARINEQADRAIRSLNLRKFFAHSAIQESL